MGYFDFSMYKFCTYLRNRKYKVHKDGNSISLHLGRLPFNSGIVQVSTFCGESNTAVTVTNGRTKYILYCYNYNSICVASSMITHLFDVTLSNGIYECVLKIILFLFGGNDRLLVDVSYLFNNDSITNEDILRNGYTSHRVNDYPKISSFGNHVGYVLTLLNKNSEYEYLVVSLKNAGSHLDKYIDTEYLGIKYDKYYKINTNINEKSLIKALKCL